MATDKFFTISIVARMEFDCDSTGLFSFFFQVNHNALRKKKLITMRSMKTSLCEVYLVLPIVHAVSFPTNKS
jgi:hypothetical protein